MSYQFPGSSGGGGGVASVTASAPLASSGGANPNISVTGVVAVANGGTGLNAAGANGQVLTVVAGAPAWAAATGFANPMTTAGDLITGGAAGAPGRLAVGANGQVLTVVAGAPAWAAAGGAAAPLTLTGSGANIPLTLTASAAQTVDWLDITANGGAAGGVFKITNSGVAVFTPGAQALPSITFLGDLTTGLFSGGGGGVAMVASGVPLVEVETNLFRLGANVHLGWPSTANVLGAGSDTGIKRSGAGIIKVTNGGAGSGSIVDLYPATDAGAAQTATAIRGGNGVPNNANGNNGDIYINSAGGALTTIYQRRAGSWVGIV